MATHLTHVVAQMGRTPTQPLFTKGGTTGDWESFGEILFPQAFPTDDVHVIAGTFGSPDRPAVVPITRSVTARGVSFVARNSDTIPGVSGIWYIALCETKEAQVQHLTFNTGVVQPRGFEPSGRQSWGKIPLHSRFRDAPVVIAAPTNLNVSSSNPAVIGIVHDVSPTEFSLGARNSDSAGGHSSFFYLAAGVGDATSGELSIDCGRTDPWYFGASGKTGDWHDGDAYFRTSFVAPPIVLITATHIKCEAPLVAPVAIARNVTTNGFVLAVRNSDSAHGRAAFDWVAFGYDALDYHRERDSILYRPQQKSYEKLAELTSAGA